MGCYLTDEMDAAILGRVVEYKSGQALRKCYAKAAKLRYEYFGVSANKECYTHEDAGSTYTKHGKTEGCKRGRGQKGKMDVYKVNMGKIFITYFITVVVHTFFL